MHGTFPLSRPHGRSSEHVEPAKFLPGLLFALMPLIIAALAAVLHSGSPVAASDILHMISGAASAAPL